MATPTYPGVYLKEVPSGVRPIAAASTSTAAFIGVAEKGDLSNAVKIYNFTEYQNLYGGFLANSYLTHSVFQFFNNGGSKCYILRVSGNNTETAHVVLNDRDTTTLESLTISAKSPGVWGNRLAIVISDGTNDPQNEFNVSVFVEDELAPLERFENLNMSPDVSNFVETAVSTSSNISVSVNPSNTNAEKGSSRGSAAPSSLEGIPRTKLKININGDGYQEIDLKNGVGSGTGQASDLSSAANIATAITYVVQNILTKLRAPTDQDAFDDFSCTVDAGVLLLKSGVKGVSSSVLVAPASIASQDASGLLYLGKLKGGQETIGGAITRPRNNPAGTPPDNYYFIGDHDASSSDEVASVQAGLDGDPILSDTPYTAAFDLLDPLNDVSLIAVPGKGSSIIVGAGMAYCENRSLSDCFFIGDMSFDEDTVTDAQSFTTGITPKNSYGAVYFPWVKMTDPLGISPEPINVPPSGFVVGLYAKTDAARGVWKAPAGTSAALAGAVGLSANLTDPQQGDLNPQNINCLRQFAASGIVVWGARTINSDPEYNYVPVRRMAIFLRVSIYNGIQWAVFEPNDEGLWSQLRLNIGSFMMTLYRRGAFQGSTPSKSFFVKCDGETTTQDDINLGIVNVLVGFAPLKPAEFVVVKISQMAGQS